MAKEKEPTFSDSLDIMSMVTIKGQPGIYLLAGNVLRNNFIRVIPLFKQGNPKMVNLKSIKFLPNFEIASTKKQDYKIGQLLDNLFKLAEGKPFTKKLTKTAIKKIAPSISPEVKEYELHKLVSYYNYIIENIETTYEVKMSEQKELLTK